MADADPPAVARAVPQNPRSPRLRAALINPPDPSSSDNFRLLPPLGLGYIAAVARMRGHHAEVFDLALSIEPSDAALDERGLFDSYGVYGVSTYSETISSTVELARRIKRRRPESIMVLGGYHASLADRALLEDFPWIDLIVRKEGEVAFANILDRVAADSRPADWSSVRGLTWRNRVGAIVRNADGEVIDPDSLPFPVQPTGRCAAGSYTRFLDGRATAAREVLSIVSSRGCPKRCTFCSIIILNPMWRSRRPSSILEEVAYNRQSGVFGHIMFQDANFFVKPSRALEFAKILYDYDPEMTWSATATADKIVKNMDIVQEIGRLNCASIEVGIESGNNNSLSYFEKGPDAETNQQALSVLERAGIHIGLDFIMFDPFMSLCDLRSNLSFLLRNDLFGYWPADFLFQELRLYPGTVLRQVCSERAGVKYGLHEVPDTPFFDPSVGEAFAAASWYRARQYRRITDVMKRYLEAVPRLLRVDERRPPHGFAAPVQQAQITSTLLRHAPYEFMCRITAETSPAEAVQRLLEEGFFASIDEQIGRLAELLAQLREWVPPPRQPSWKGLESA